MRKFLEYWLADLDFSRSKLVEIGDMFGAKPTTKSQTSQKSAATNPGSQICVAIWDNRPTRQAAIRFCTTAVANCDDIDTQTKWAAIVNALPGTRRNQALGFRRMKAPSVGFVLGSRPQKKRDVI